MILLDTNVLSEFMHLQPSTQVVAWLDRQAPNEIWTNAVSRAEIELGLALMPEGKRQKSLSQTARAMFDEDFAGRCLPFDEIAASYYGAYRFCADSNGAAHQRGGCSDRCDCTGASNAFVYA